jgi:lipoyl(octanoyl) transferase
VQLAGDRPLEVVWWGRRPYQAAWNAQRALHAEVVAGTKPDTLVLVEHDAVFTAGRRTTEDERPVSGELPVVDVDRGGKITWHGPGQLVGYPIVRLPEPLDVVSYVRRLEQLLMDTTARFGVTTRRVEGRSGIWSDEPSPSKVGAIGIRVARGVTLHGFALNADCDLADYAAIVPCGIRDAGVTTLSRLAGRAIGVQEAKEALLQVLRADEQVAA